MLTRTLNNLKLNETAVVSALHVAGAERHRLLDLGILIGTQITAELISPLGDPLAYRVRGTLIALRRAQAQQIQIQAQNEGAGI